MAALASFGHRRRPDRDRRSARSVGVLLAGRSGDGLGWDGGRRWTLPGRHGGSAVVAGSGLAVSRDDGQFTKARYVREVLHGIEGDGLVRRARGLRPGNGPTPRKIHIDVSPAGRFLYRAIHTKETGPA